MLLVEDALRFELRCLMHSSDLRQPQSVFFFEHCDVVHGGVQLRLRHRCSEISGVRKTVRRHDIVARTFGRFDIRSVRNIVRLTERRCVDARHLELRTRRGKVIREDRRGGGSVRLPRELQRCVLADVQLNIS